MKRALISVFAVILCVVFCFGAAADGEEQVYTAAGGDALVVAVFVIVCALTLAVLITLYQIQKKRLRKKNREALLQAQSQA